jgi:hypothetical protein
VLQRPIRAGMRGLVRVPEHDSSEREADQELVYNDELTACEWALNSAVECHLHTVEVIGSNPIAPTIVPLQRGDGFSFALLVWAESSPIQR